MTGEMERKHGPDCDCTRCTGFQPVHGAYGKDVSQRAEQLDSVLVAAAPWLRDADLAHRSILTNTLARIKLIYEYLDEHGLLDGHGTPRPALKVLSTWENTALRAADRLGLTPSARAAIGADLGIAVRGGATSALSLLQLVADAEVEQARAQLENIDDEGGSDGG